MAGAALEESLTKVGGAFANFFRSDNLIQFCVIVLALGLAWGLTAWVLRTRAKDGKRRRLVRYLGFPFLSMVFLEVALLALEAAELRASAVSIAVGLAFAMFVLRLIELALRQIFPQSTWLANAERYLAVTIWTLAALQQIGVLGGVIEWLDHLSIHLGKQRITVWMLIQSILTIGGTMIAAMWLSGVIEERLQAAERIDSSARAVLARVVKALLIFVGLLTSMSLVGLDFTTLSVFSGALGIGLGFGLQKIASNYVAGFIILFERSIRIGNLISVGSERGEVREITTRYTMLRALNGIDVIVPNETLISSTVQNETFIDPNVMLSIRVQVAYNADVERALAVLKECALVHERVLRDPPPSSALANFGESGIDLDLAFWLLDPRLGAGGVRSAINREIWRRFNEEGIQFPYPQREIRILNNPLSVLEEGRVAHKQEQMSV
ncbi:MAG: mechanosensitive ion channel [Betaproteobacteria bacterium]|nr:mechanosensitive ion channel [Betaproteobacteria bacterium]